LELQEVELLQTLSKSDRCALRIFDIVASEELRDKFVSRNDQLSRALIDGRNSDLCPKDFYTLVADLFNDGPPTTTELFPIRNTNDRIRQNMLHDDEGRNRDKG